MRHRGLVTVAVSFLLLALGFAERAEADDPVVRIEEDWELVVRSPDHEITAPQVITAFSPLPHLAGVHATFEINHIASVAFATGGLHLSTWSGDTHLQVAHAGNYASMFTDGEVVRWTQAIELKDNQLIFEIINGSSTTWGNFGGNESLRLQLDTTLETLMYYSPTVSIAKSEVSFAGNRVDALSMKRLRYIRASGQVFSENTQRYVHRAEDYGN